MPTHKKVPMMYATLISVFSQDFDDFEFIIVDASKDSYFEKELEELLKMHAIEKRKDKLSKIKILHPESGQNFPGAMKTYGFKHCVQDNDFVVFLDHDDFLGTELLKYIRLAQTQYPDTEMISTNYTSMVYDHGNIMTNLETYAGGETCGSTDTIYIGDIYFKFNGKQDIYKNNHPFRSAICPKIISKQALRDNKFKFVTDTERMDDFAWPIMTHALIETYIPITGYVYMAYDPSNPSNSCCPERIVSENARQIENRCLEYEKVLYEFGYKKHRNTCII